MMRSLFSTPNVNGISLVELGGVETLQAGIYFSRGELAEASKCIKTALECNNPQALEIHATLLYVQGQLEQARQWTDAALRAGSGNAMFLLFAAMLEAELGNLDLAFQRIAEFVRRTHLFPPLPQWCGEPIGGKTVFIPRTLGGFGDEVLWVRFASELAKRGAQVVMDCAPALRTLFRTVPGVTIGDSAGADCFCFMQEIPRYLGTSRETMPTQPYLCAPRPLELERESAFKIGISWGCAPLGPQTRYCSLGELAPLAQLAGVQLYSLEKSQHAEQLYPPPVGMRVVDLGPSLADFADTANAIAAMDLIVSTDNIVANLAGALGKPFCVLVPFVPDFRWARDDTSPWYPSARVFRQSRPGNWREVVAAVAEHIKPMLAA